MLEDHIRHSFGTSLRQLAAGARKVCTNSAQPRQIVAGRRRHLHAHTQQVINTKTHLLIRMCTCVRLPRSPPPSSVSLGPTLPLCGQRTSGWVRPTFPPRRDRSSPGEPPSAGFHLHCPLCNRNLRRRPTMPPAALCIACCRATAAE